MTEEEKDKLTNDVIDMCTNAGLYTFNRMRKMTSRDNMALTGLEAYIYGFLAPMFASMYAGGVPKDVEEKVKATVISMMDVISSETDKRRALDAAKSRH